MLVVRQTQAHHKNISYLFSYFLASELIQTFHKNGFFALFREEFRFPAKNDLV